MKRYLAKYIQEDLDKKIILLTGPRQAGKTTLSKMLKNDFDYFNFDNLDDRLSLQKKSWDRAKDLVIFDVESDEGGWAKWRYRVWALRSSKLPIRILGRSSAGARIDCVYSYIKEQPKEFFDPEIFESKLKDPTNSVHS